MKKLVAYFSCTGTTLQLAKKIADITEGELYEIKPKTPYTSEALDWNNPNSRTTKECNDSKLRPEIINDFQDQGYDIIYIGFPIWWYKEPNIIDTFLEKYNFENKIVIPFATSGGSSITQTEEQLKRNYPEINWKKGACFTSIPTDTILKEWIESIEQ